MNSEKHLRSGKHTRKNSCHESIGLIARTIHWGVPPVILIVMFAAVGLLKSRPSGAPDANIQRVVLVSIDTCRADRLGCYGNSQGLTPNIDALAAESVLFENVVSPAPMTLPSHCSMMTGLDPMTHGVHDNFAYRLSPSVNTLAELMRGCGMATGAVVSSFVLNSKYGMDQGFGVYDDDLPQKRTVFGDLSERRGDEATQLAINWLKTHREEPAFLFLHYYDPHAPYEAPDPFASQWREDPYSGEIAYVDSCIGRLVDWLRESGLYDTTLIVLTGDHGEMLGEHGERTHSYFVYESAIRVPLVVKTPGINSARRVTEIVGLVDLLPTLCGLVGVDCPSVDGRDLQGIVLADADADNEDGELYCESITPVSYNANPLRALVSQRWKYIHANRPELYDWRADPGEEHNLVDIEPEVAADMSSRLRQRVESAASSRNGAETMSVDGESRRNLEALGYVGATISEGTNYFDERMCDPKDRIAFHENVKHLAVLVARGQIEAAEETCRSLLADWPEYQRGYVIMARIALERSDYAAAEKHVRAALALDSLDVEALEMEAKLSWLRGQPAEAVSQYERLIDRDGGSTDVHNGLGIALASQGKTQEGIKHFREALKLDPRSPETNHNLASALLNEGKVQEAIGHFRLVLAIDPRMAEAHNGLGMALQAHGELQEAADCFRRVIELAPERADVHCNLGSVMARQHRFEDAVKQYRAALSLDPDYAKAHNNLALALIVMGRSSEAVEHYREAVRIRPDWLDALNGAAWIMATHAESSVRSPSEAVVYAERAAELSGRSNASVLDTLAAAYASAGRFADAVAAGEQALALAKVAADVGQAGEIRERLQLYRQGRAYYDVKYQ